MSKTISIGELRQNWTRILREVRDGTTYTINDHDEPIAELTPRRAPRWISSGEIDSLLRELSADEIWAGEIASERRAVNVIDPWERVE